MWKFSSQDSFKNSVSEKKLIEKDLPNNKIKQFTHASLHDGPSRTAVKQSENSKSNIKVRMGSDLSIKSGGVGAAIQQRRSNQASQNSQRSSQKKSNNRKTSQMFGKVEQS